MPAPGAATATVSGHEFSSSAFLRVSGFPAQRFLQSNFACSRLLADCPADDDASAQALGAVWETVVIAKRPVAIRLDYFVVPQSGTSRTDRIPKQRLTEKAK